MSISEPVDEPIAIRLERQRFAQTQGRSPGGIAFAAENAARYFNAGRQERSKYMDPVKLAAEAVPTRTAHGGGRQLGAARRRATAFYAETTAQLARAKSPRSANASA